MTIVGTVSSLKNLYDQTNIGDEPPLAELYKLITRTEYVNISTYMEDVYNDYDGNTIKYLFLLLKTKSCRKLYNNVLLWFIHNNAEVRNLLRINLINFPKYGSWGDLLNPKLLHDREFRDTICELYSQQLKKDLNELDTVNNTNYMRISDAARCAPSEGKKLDRESNIVIDICNKLIPTGDTQEKYQLYRTKYLTPLRRFLKSYSSRSDYVNPDVEAYTNVDVDVDVDFDVETKITTHSQSQFQSRSQTRLTNMCNISAESWDTYINNSTMDNSLVTISNVSTVSTCHLTAVLPLLMSRRGPYKNMLLVDDLLNVNLTISDKDTFTTQLQTINLYNCTLDNQLKNILDQGLSPDILYYISNNVEIDFQKLVSVLEMYTFRGIIPPTVYYINMETTEFVFAKKYEIDDFSLFTLSGFNSAVFQLIKSDQNLTNEDIISKELEMMEIITAESSLCSIM